MAESYATFATTWFDGVWNQGNEAVIDAMRHPDVHVYGFPDPGSVTGSDGFLEAYRRLRAAFSDLRVTVDDQAIDGDKIVARWTASGTHTGNSLGFPATGRRVIFSGASFMYIADGKITESWNFYDFTRVLGELRA